MNKYIALLQKLEKTIGGLKFAVCIILTFTTCMIVGTFVESFYGTDFANRLIYKSLPFMILQYCLFLSITMAALLRLPPKNRLYGFYVTHLGLILTLIGSFVTYYSGIDGNVTLVPNSPSRFLTLPQKTLYITNKSNGKEISYRLPYNAFTTNIDIQFENIKLKKFLPSSINELKWVKEKLPTSTLQRYRHSSRYLISNDNVSQDFLVSLHPENLEFESSIKLGPLSIHYMPKDLIHCFNKTKKSGYIIWNDQSGKCSIPEDRGVEVQKTSTGKKFILFEENGKRYAFFPELSPWPIDAALKINSNSQIRIFNQQMFLDSPNLFLFGKGVAFFEDDKWVTKNFTNKKIELPWMNFKLELLKHNETLVPKNIPQFTLPIQDNGQVIRGEQMAVLIEVDGKEYWVKTNSPVSIQSSGQKFNIELGNRVLKLPYEFNLTKFKMDTNPGTRDPSSYESFVDLFDSNGRSSHHIYMNYPLKYDGFTFYQASYFPTKTGAHGSVLSVNFDPGRWIKYLGAILLVFGTIWHFYINKKKTKKVI